MAGKISGGFLEALSGALGGSLGGANPNAVASLLGQLAQVDPNAPIGGQLGSIGTQMAQTNLMDQQRQQLASALGGQGSSGPGVGQLATLLSGGSTLGLTPQQAQQQHLNAQNLFNTVLKETDARRRTDIAGRAQNLAEQQFGSKEKDAESRRQAIERLSGVTAENINKADAGDLANISAGSISAMLYSSARDKSKNKPQDVLLYEAMEEQKTKLGLKSIFETPLWKIKTTSKSKDTDEQAKFKRELLKGMSNNPVLSRKPIEELDARAQKLTDAAFNAKRVKALDEVTDEEDLFQSIMDAVEHEKALEELEQLRTLKSSH